MIVFLPFLLIGLAIAIGTGIGELIASLGEAETLHQGRTLGVERVVPGLIQHLGRERNLWFGADKKPYEPRRLYEEILSTVYAFRPANTDWRSFGSAVAISPRFLLTTCEFLRGADTGWIHQEQALIDSVTLVWDDQRSGRCIFRTDFIDLESFATIRSYESLSIGETTIAVGKPGGYNFFLSQGLVSERSVEHGVRKLKTSSVVAPGSFGCGVFDSNGLLIGINSSPKIWYHYQAETTVISAEDFIAEGTELRSFQEFLHWASNEASSISSKSA